MASVDLGRLVTESLNRFGGEAQTEDAMDLADVFTEAAANKLKGPGKYGTGYNAGKATAAERAEQKARMAAAATADGVKAAGRGIAKGAKAAYHGSAAGAVNSIASGAKSGASAVGSHLSNHKGKYIAGGAALAGLGAVAYKYMKNKKKKKEAAGK